MKNYKVKLFIMFVSGVIFSMITVFAVTITVPTNFTTNTVQYLQKLVMTDSSGSTGIVLDGTNNKIMSDTICDTNGNNCKIVSQLITGDALNDYLTGGYLDGYLSGTTTFLTGSNGKWCIMSGSKIECFQNTPSGGSSYTLPIANSSTLGGVRTSSEILADTSGILSIANSSITENKIANNAVSNQKIINSSITQDKVQNGFIDLNTNQIISGDKDFNNNISVSGTGTFNNICLSSSCRSTRPITNPAGSDGQIQFKSGSSFAANSNLSWINGFLRVGEALIGKDYTTNNSTTGGSFLKIEGTLPSFTSGNPKFSPNIQLNYKKDVGGIPTSYTRDNWMLDNDGSLLFKYATGNNIYQNKLNIKKNGGIQLYQYSTNLGGSSFPCSQSEAGTIAYHEGITEGFLYVCKKVSTSYVRRRISDVPY